MHRDISLWTKISAPRTEQFAPSRATFEENCELPATDVSKISIPAYFSKPNKGYCFIVIFPFEIFKIMFFIPDSTISLPLPH